MRAGRWGTAWSGGPFLGREVSGVRLGIVGLGRIGSAVAQRARGFDMEVLHYRRTRSDDAGYGTSTTCCTSPTSSRSIRH